MSDHTDQAMMASSGRTLNFLALLASLLFVLAFVPVFEPHRFGNLLLKLGFTAILVFSVFASVQKRTVLIPMLAVMSAGLAISWVAFFIDNSTLFVVSCFLLSFVFLMTAIAILANVLRRHFATVQSIFGAICTYLLLGLAWALLYWATERIEDESLRFVGRAPAASGVRDVAPFSQLIYFSFVTMSTLGYGDITPETPAARTLTWMQSVTGQFYLAVLVAWLVSAIPKQPMIEGRQTASSPNSE